MRTKFIGNLNLTAFLPILPSDQWIFSYLNIQRFMESQQVVGYLHIVVHSLSLENSSQPIHAHITLGEIAKADTTPKPSGQTINQVFLFQVAKNLPRFVLNCNQGDKKIAQCRYDISAFVQRDRITNKLHSDLFDNQSKKIGSVVLELTYYSGQYGKLRIRIFHLEFHPDTVAQFKEARVKVLCGLHAQSTPVKSLGQDFDEKVEVLVLMPKRSLIFQVVHEKGVIASYTIKNMEEDGVLCEQPKAYQVSLFNNGKAIGLIKYQINWLK